MYRRAHTVNTRWFSGRIDLESVDAIATLVRETDAKRLLDFGSGKGYQYLADRVHDRWGGILPVCYDVGVEFLDHQPIGLFDGVICTDVMEHIYKDDIINTLDQIFGYLRLDVPTFAYFNVSCNPSGKHFPGGGGSVHLTVKSVDWWERVFSEYRCDGSKLWVDYEYDFARCDNM